MSSTKFSNFHRQDVTYKTINDHAIDTAILVPKAAHTGPRPVLVHFHGGFLILGDKMFEDWFATWLVQFAESKGAVIVSPNYRLLPEATGNDILDDMADFWDWVQTSLPTEVAKVAAGTEVDLGKVISTGESAGGYLAVQSALLFPKANISAVISSYGMLDIGNPHFTEPGVKFMAGSPAQPESVVDDYIKSLPPNAMRSSADTQALWFFIVSTVQHARLPGFLGKEDRLYPIKNLEHAGKVPPMWIFHGSDDSLVPLAVSSNFVDVLKEKKSSTPVLFTVRSGEHGFDGGATFENDWVKEGCSWVGEFWS